MSSIGEFSVSDEDRHRSIAEEHSNANENLLFVFPELRDSFQQSSMDQHRFSGVLWKRRDIFKNRWRPRWFHLHPSQGILTYYLLNEHLNDRTPPPNRSRMNSWDSQMSGVSTNTVDYDVVPRGTIFLLGSSVSVNTMLSRPAENLFAFTIKNNENCIHLAARSNETRQQWIDHIRSVCNRRFQTPARANSVPVDMPSQHLQRMSIPEVEHEDDEQDVWKSTTPTFDDVPESLVKQINSKLDQFLPLCEDETGWTTIFEHQNGHSAYSKPTDSGRSIIKSKATLPYSCAQIFGLLFNISRRHEFETNVRVDERLKVLNKHTVLDYYAYNAVWPTSAREFVVCTSWQLMTKHTDQAIVMVSFSCLEAEALKQETRNHVRARCEVSLYILRELLGQQTELTRLLCFDLGGGVSHHLSNVIASQQAGLPAVIEDFLNDELPDDYHAPLSNETLLGIVDQMKTVSNGLERPPSPTTPFDKSLVVSDEVKVPKLVSLELQAVILLAPVLLFRLVLLVGLPLSEAFFLILSFLAVRQVVLLHIRKFADLSAQPCHGPVTLRFKVDAKGVHRFIANKKEESEEFKTGNTDVTVAHIVACALARAVRSEPILQHRRVRIPYLLIDAVADTSLDPVDVTLLSMDNKRITLKEVNTKQIQRVADEHNASKVDESSTNPRYLLLDASAMEKPASSVEVAPADLSTIVVAVLKLPKQDKGGTANSSSKKKKIKSMVSIAVTIGGYRQPDMETCSRFVDELQKLIQFPEVSE